MLTNQPDTALPEPIPGVVGRDLRQDGHLQALLWTMPSGRCWGCLGASMGSQPAMQGNLLITWGALKTCHCRSPTSGDAQLNWSGQDADNGPH